MKRRLINALDWLIGKLWNPAGWILNLLDPKGARMIRRIERAHAKREKLPRLTGAQLDDLRKKIEKEFPPVPASEWETLKGTRIRKDWP